MSDEPSSPAIEELEGCQVGIKKTTGEYGIDEKGFPVERLD